MGGALYAAAGERLSRATILTLCACLMLLTSLAFVKVASRHFLAADRRHRASEDDVELAPVVVTNALLRDGDDDDAAPGEEADVS